MYCHSFNFCKKNLLGKGAVELKGYVNIKYSKISKWTSKIDVY